VLLVVIAVVACVGEWECSITSALVLLAPEGAMRVASEAPPMPAMPAAAAAAAAASSAGEGFCSDISTAFCLTRAAAMYSYQC
jgi:hypothetical protein